MARANRVPVTPMLFPGTPLETTDVAGENLPDVVVEDEAEEDSPLGLFPPGPIGVSPGWELGPLLGPEVVLAAAVSVEEGPMTDLVDAEVSLLFLFLLCCVTPTGTPTHIAMITMRAMMKSMMNFLVL